MTQLERTNMESIIALCKRKGFIFQGSEIYGGLSGTWDYGPLGVALKNNIKQLWWKRFVTDREDMYGVDAAILMNQNVWKASGHVGGFSDPLVECLNCHTKFRVDHLDFSKSDFEKWTQALIDVIQEEVNNLNDEFVIVDKLEEDLNEYESVLNKVNFSQISPEEKKLLNEFVDMVKQYQSKIDNAKKREKAIPVILEMYKQNKRFHGPFMRSFLNRFVRCPNDKKEVDPAWSTPTQFNMMFQTNYGPVASDDSISYLRPETAQGMFVNFKNVLDSMHPKMPFGLAQIGKAFRNEIAPRDFIFRTREFEQMEIEYFVHPSQWVEAFSHFQDQVWSFIKDIGISSEKVSELEVADEDRAHYSKRTIDFEFEYPFGKKELYGLAYRTDFDLKNHSKDAEHELGPKTASDLSYFDEETKERYIPHCIEPSFGLDRTVLAVLTDAYTVDELGGEKREYLKLSPKVAPILVAVSPLLKNKPHLVEKARHIYAMLKKQFGRVVFDDNGNIGKRYRRQDEIGTPFCVVVDFETIEGLKDVVGAATGLKAGDMDTVTIRHRDTGEQERVVIENLITYIVGKI